MIRRCEVDAIRLALQDVSGNQINIEPTDITFRDRRGYDLQFYLNVELARPFDVEKLRYRRFQANLTINDRYHPFWVLVYSSTSVELEKWDDRELLPEDDDYVKISLKDTEGF